MDFHTLQNFLKVANTLHFTNASKEACIAQPALSRQIKQLEESLNATLFIRNKRKVQLSEAGLYFKMEVEKLISQMNYICKRTAEIDKGEAGEVRIGYTHSSMQTFLPILIKRIKLEFPNIKVVMHELSNLQQTEALERKEIEIGFATNPVITGNIQSTILLRDNFVVVLPWDHPVDASNYTDFGVFAREDLILPPKHDSYLYIATIESICVAAGFVPNVVHETTFAATGLRLVEAGLGITIEPKSGLRGHAARIKYIELRNIPQKAELTMLWHKELDTQRPKLMNLIVDFIEYLKSSNLSSGET